MNKCHFFSIAASLAVTTLITVSVADRANASELFEPQNSHLTQSELAPGSRFFVAVDDETAVTANERYVNSPNDGQALFATTDRQAIARWLAWAERERSVSLAFPASPQAPVVTEAGTQSAIHQSNVESVTAPLRVSSSVGPFYAE